MYPLNSVMNPARPKGKHVDPASDYLICFYEVLNNHFGNLHWWPGGSTLEILIGAVLTQNTAWRNVEQAIRNLKRESLICIEDILDIDQMVLEELLRPTGFFRVKIKRLRNLLQFIAANYDGDLERMFEEEIWSLREKLLSIHGIGEETADCILLYGGLKSIFVVDAYTRRILERHGLLGPKMTYGDIQDLFMSRLPHDQPLFGQYHALLVEAGKRFCRNVPRCGECPLKKFLVETVKPPQTGKNRNGEKACCLKSET